MSGKCISVKTLSIFIFLLDVLKNNYVEVVEKDSNFQK